MTKRERRPSGDSRNTHSFTEVREGEAKIAGKRSDNLTERIAALKGVKTFHGILETFRFGNHKLKKIGFSTRNVFTIDGVELEHSWRVKIHENEKASDWLKEKREISGTGGSQKDVREKLRSFITDRNGLRKILPSYVISSSVCDLNNPTLHDWKTRQTHEFPKKKREPKWCEPLIFDDDIYEEINGRLLKKNKRPRVYEIEVPCTPSEKIPLAKVAAIKRKRAQRLIKALGLIERFNPKTSGLSSKGWLISVEVLTEENQVTPDFIAHE